VHRGTSRSSCLCAFERGSFNSSPLERKVAQHCRTPLRTTHVRLSPIAVVRVVGVWEWKELPEERRPQEVRRDDDGPSPGSSSSTEGRAAAKPTKSMAGVEKQRGDYVCQYVEVDLGQGPGLLRRKHVRVEFRAQAVVLRRRGDADAWKEGRSFRGKIGPVSWCAARLRSGKIGGYQPPGTEEHGRAFSVSTAV
jgi:hypothetical protein